MMTAANVEYELADRTSATAYGGVASVHRLAGKLGLPEAIDRNLHLVKIHLPYHESDHVLNLAYNTLCGGTCIEDLELRRCDAAYLDALGARRVPDPTTAGDFCRRFTEQSIRALLEVCHQARRKIWAQQPKQFFEQEATIDFDGVIVETGGECKQGIGIAYNGKWGYHPLIVSLANTGEVLSLVNRPGNRPSHEGAAAEADRAVEVCLQGGFTRVLLRGDTAFTQTKYLDRWDDDGRIRFIFGVDVKTNMHILADDLPEKAWKPLQRPPRGQVRTEPRRRPQNVKQPIVIEREFENLRLNGEEVAEFAYRPRACKRDYRIIALRKNLSVEKGGQWLFDDYRYFLYITNDWRTPAEQIVLSANGRCDQENLIAQLKGGVRCLHAPVDTLLSNWAYMLMTALGWNLKAWWALMLPERPGRWAERHREEKRRVLRMEFRTFVNAFMRMPAQVLRTSRRIVCRLLAWNPWQHVFFRLTDQLRHPLRC